MDKNAFKEEIYNYAFSKLAETSPAEAAGKDKHFSNKEAENFAKDKKAPYDLEDAMKLGKKIGIDWEKVDFKPADFLAGLGVEVEHFNDKVTRVQPKYSDTIVGRIAWRHLRENPKYYVNLKD